MSPAILQSIGTVLAVLAFAGVVWWAYGSKRKARFEQDALIIFAEDDLPSKPSSTSKTETAPRSSH